MDFAQRVIVITGAARGIGSALAAAFLHAGANVAMIDVCPAVRDTAEALAETYRGTVRAYLGDVGDTAEIVRVAAEIEADFGRVDVLVSNAGIVIAGGLDEIKPNDWERVIRVNLLGFYHVCRAFLAALRRAKSASIVQVNSKSGKSGSFKNSAYCASKFGGLGAVQSFALELAPDNIRVNAVCPGNLLDSPLWEESLYDQYAARLEMTRDEVRARYESKVPLGQRGCTYDDVTQLVLFLASEKSRYMTGQAINVTGGQEMH